eukprot:6487902-Amphidinium_carterae.1
MPTQAHAMVLEGTLPNSASRMTFRQIVLSFGHGLRGWLPHIPGTMSLLSVWENALEGHLHDLRMRFDSSLL